MKQLTLEELLKTATDLRDGGISEINLNDNKT